LLHQQWAVSVTAKKHLLTYGHSVVGYNNVLSNANLVVWVDHLLLCARRQLDVVIADKQILADDAHSRKLIACLTIFVSSEETGGQSAAARPSSPSGCR